MATYYELLAQHAVTEVHFNEAIDLGEIDQAAEIERKKYALEQEIKARPEHAAYVQSLIDAGAHVAARWWQS